VKCDPQKIGVAMAVCRVCRQPLQGDSLPDCPGPGTAQPASPQSTNEFTAQEIAVLLPGIEDQTLIGNRLAAMFKEIGFPPCEACDDRRAYLNRAELWLRNYLG